MNFLTLPLLWLIPAVVRGRRSLGRLALGLALVVAAISLLGLLLKLLSQFYQINEPIIALALPAHAGLAAGLWKFASPSAR
jgi:hypothetical protein